MNEYQSCKLLGERLLKSDRPVMKIADDLQDMNRNPMLETMLNYRHNQHFIMMFVQKPMDLSGKSEESEII